MQQPKQHKKLSDFQSRNSHRKPKQISRSGELFNSVDASGNPRIAPATENTLQKAIIPWRKDTIKEGHWGFVSVFFELGRGSTFARLPQGRHTHTENYHFRNPNNHATAPFQHCENGHRATDNPNPVKMRPPKLQPPHYDSFLDNSIEPRTEP